MNGPLTEKDVEFEFTAEPEESSVRGNASAVDPETDKEIEDWILYDIERGNAYAWFCAKVVARYNGLEGHAILGCCSYPSEREFLADQYYTDMRAEALAMLNAKILEEGIGHGAAE